MRSNAERNADLYLRLKADSGYESTEAHRVSPDQWARINEILNEPEPAKEPANA